MSMMTAGGQMLQTYLLLANNAVSIAINSVTPETFADGDTGITIDGEGFESSQGTGKVELGDSSDYDTATLVEQRVPENLVTNGGFETDTSGWSTVDHTIARSTSQSKFDSAALEITRGDDDRELAWYDITLTAEAHSASCWVYIPSSWDGGDIELRLNFSNTSGGTINAFADMDTRDAWQRIEVPNVIIDSENLTGDVRIRQTFVSAGTGEVIYVDGVQVEAGEQATEYIETDGSTENAWSDTSIDFTVDQGALDAGAVYVFVTNDSGDRTDGFEARLISAALAGSLPAFSGGLAAQASYARGVSGMLPAQSGSLGSEQALARAVSGSLAPQSGVLAAQLALARALAGELPAMIGEIASIGNLSGELLAMNGELEGFQAAVRLAGELPAMGGGLEAVMDIARDLAGNLPAQDGALAVDITFRQVGLAGSLPVMSGVLVVFQSSVALEGVLGFSGDLGAPVIGLILPVPGHAATSAMLIQGRSTAGMLPRGRAGGPRPERGRGR